MVGSRGVQTINLPKYFVRGGGETEFVGHYVPTSHPLNTAASSSSSLSSISPTSSSRGGGKILAWLESERHELRLLNTCCFHSCNYLTQFDPYYFMKALGRLQIEYSLFVETEPEPEKLLVWLMQLSTQVWSISLHEGFVCLGFLNFEPGDLDRAESAKKKPRKFSSQSWAWLEGS